MAHNDKITTSLRGRRFGLEIQSTNVSGGSRGEQEYLVGPESLRVGVTTAETTSTNLHPFGVSRLEGSSAGSSQVFTIDPPVPGVRKTVVNSTVAATLLKTANDETIVTTGGSSFTTIDLPSGGAAFELVGITTAQWAGIGLSTASGFTLSTST